MPTTRLEKAFRLTARVWGFGSLLFLFAFIVGHLNAPRAAPTMSEWPGLAFFPAGIVVGLLIAIRKDLLGGAIAVLSLFGFYVWHMLVAGRMPEGPWFLGIAAPGFLHLIAGLLARRRPFAGNGGSNAETASRLTT